MIELVITIAVLAALIMFSGKIVKAMDWTGGIISKTADPIEHGLEALTKQTARAVIVSDTSLAGTKLEGAKAHVANAKARSAFVKDLDKDQMASLTNYEKKFAHY